MSAAKEALARAKLVENKVRKFDAVLTLKRQSQRYGLNPVAWLGSTTQEDMLGRELTAALRWLLEAYRIVTANCKELPTGKWLVSISRDEPQWWHVRLCPKETENDPRTWGIQYMFEGNHKSPVYAGIQMIVNICYSGLVLTYGWLPTDTIYVTVLGPYEEDKIDEAKPTIPGNGMPGEVPHAD